MSQLQYKELETLGPDELFVSWAYMVSGGDELRVAVKRVIKRDEQSTFERALRLKHNAQEIHITTIEKDREWQQKEDTLITI